MPFRSPGDLSDSWIDPVSPAWQAECLPLSHHGNPMYIYMYIAVCVCSVVCNSLRPHGLQPSRLRVHGIHRARILEWVAFPFSRGSCEPRSPTSETDFLLSEPPGKPKNTGVDSPSFLQGVFLIQGSNPGLPHCRWILYSLNH